MGECGIIPVQPEVCEQRGLRRVAFVGGREMVRKSITIALGVFLFSFFAGTAGADSITLQQGINNYAGTYDTWLSMNDYDENFGSDWDIHVRYDHYATYDDRVTLIKFNLAGQLPANAVIDGASLSMLYYDDWNISSSDYITAAAYRLMKNWTEGSGGSGSDRTGAAWYYQYAYPDTTQWYNGGARGVNHDRSGTADDTETLYNVDSYCWATWSGASMAASVQNWYNNPSQNYGWAIDVTYSTDNQNGAIFHSSEYSTSPADYIWRPKLTIDYHLIPEPATLALLLTGSLILRRKSLAGKNE